MLLLVDIERHSPESVVGQEETMMIPSQEKSFQEDLNAGEYNS